MWMWTYSPCSLNFWLYAEFYVESATEKNKTNKIYKLFPRGLTHRSGVILAACLPWRQPLLLGSLQGSQLGPHPRGLWPASAIPPNTYIIRSWSHRKFPSIWILSTHTTTCMLTCLAHRVPSPSHVRGRPREGEGRGLGRALHHTVGSRQWHRRGQAHRLRRSPRRNTHTGRQHEASLKKQGVKLPCDPAGPLLGK